MYHDHTNRTMITGTHVQNSTDPSHFDIQVYRGAVAMYTQRAFDDYDPDLVGHIDEARRMVLDPRWQSQA
jgi:hypothetical protein